MAFGSFAFVRLVRSFHLYLLLYNPQQKPYLIIFVEKSLSWTTQSSEGL